MSRRVLLRVGVLAGLLFLLVGPAPQVSTLMSAEPATDDPFAEPATPDPFAEPATAGPFASPIGSTGLSTSPAETKTLKALAEPTELDFIEEPLQGVVDYLSDRHGIQIVFDTRALEDLSCTTEEPVTLRLKGISLRSALDLVLLNQRETWTIDSEVLLLATPEEVEARMAVKVYDVADLVACRDGDGQLWEDYDTLVNTIRSMVAINSWEGSAGGPGSIEGATFGSAKVLVIRQTYRVQREVAQLLHAIRAMPSESTGVPANTAETKILKVLAEPTELDFIEEPLRGVVDYLSDRHDIQIVFDERAMEDLRLTTEEPVTFKLSGVSLRSALDLVLQDLDMAWTIDSEVLLITTQDVADENCFAKVYHVGDLVTYCDEDGKRWDDYDMLFDTICSTVAPDSWEEGIGPPSDIVVGTFGRAKVLVVRKTWPVQLEIAQLLDTIRKISKMHATDHQPPVRKRTRLGPAGVMGGMGDGMGDGTSRGMGMFSVGGGLRAGFGGGMGAGSATGEAAGAVEKPSE